MPTYDVNKIAQRHTFKMSLPRSYALGGGGILGGVADIVAAKESADAQSAKRAQAASGGRMDASKALRAADDQLELLGYAKPSREEGERFYNYARGRGKLAQRILRGESLSDDAIMTEMGRELLKPKYRPRKDEIMDMAIEAGYDPENDEGVSGTRVVDRAMRYARQAGRRPTSEEIAHIVAGAELDPRKPLADQLQRQVYSDVYGDDMPKGEGVLDEPVPKAATGEDATKAREELQLRMERREFRRALGLEKEADAPEQQAGSETKKSDGETVVDTIADSVEREFEQVRLPPPRNELVEKIPEIDRIREEDRRWALQDTGAEPKQAKRWQDIQEASTKIGALDENPKALLAKYADDQGFLDEVSARVAIMRKNRVKDAASANKEPAVILGKAKASLTDAKDLRNLEIAITKAEKGDRSMLDKVLQAIAKTKNKGK